MRNAEASISVIKLPKSRLSEAAGVLAHSYHDHPNFIDFFPDEKVRDRVLPHVCIAGLRDALGFGHVYAATRGGEIVGVAAWLPPGAFPLSPRRQLRVLPDMIRVLATAPRPARRLLRFMISVVGRHPEQPYWYLENVGVKPAAQGLGAGTRLLEPVLSLADAAGQPCYLETQTERNVAWYRKLGFEVREAGVRFVPGGPPNWTMIRYPVRDQAGRDRESSGSGDAQRGETR
jgi:ribosomal protein S18 acetylase RimI-like enzyme